MSTAPFITLVPASAANQPNGLQAGGDWILAHYRQLEPLVARLGDQLTANSSVDLSGLGRLDTSGAALLIELLGQARSQQLEQFTADLAPQQRALLVRVAQAMLESQHNPPPPPLPPAWLWFGEIGLAVLRIAAQLAELLGFLGLTLARLGACLLHPKRWRLTPLIAQIERCGLDAVPIVALLSFMVGAVVAFLGATILADFGASLYTVNLVAFSFLREFAVLLTAILLAGRTASAFTAQLGSMQANQEIDALRTLGLDPIELLVLPRLLALLVSLPILTFIAMLCGLAGGALVCALSLDISLASYLRVIQDSIELRHFWIGLGKAPLFALLIGLIGCLHGFKVSGSAASLGEHTTASVVQSICLVILLDALLALLAVELGW